MTQLGLQRKVREVKDLKAYLAEQSRENAK
jgi:hypothetical protein